MKRRREPIPENAVKKQKKECFINALPEELLVMIFKFCSVYTTVQCLQVCRRWNNICKEEPLLPICEVKGIVLYPQRINELHGTHDCDSCSDVYCSHCKTVSCLNCYDYYFVETSCTDCLMPTCHQCIYLFDRCTSCDLLLCDDIGHESYVIDEVECNNCDGKFCSDCIKRTKLQPDLIDSYSKCIIKECPCKGSILCISCMDGHIEDLTSTYGII